MAWVRLNVGGEMMETSLATVTKYPDSHLAKMFLSSVPENSGNEEMETAESSAVMGSSGEGQGKEEMFNIVYNIDCDPDSFKLILSWLR